MSSEYTACRQNCGWCFRSNTRVGKSQAAALAGGVRANCLHSKTKTMNATPADKGQANEIAEDLRGIR